MDHPILGGAGPSPFPSAAHPDFGAEFSFSVDSLCMASALIVLFLLPVKKQRIPVNPCYKATVAQMGPSV